MAQPPPTLEDPVGALLNLHYALETEHDDGDKGNFLFGWQCENPYAADLIASTRNRTQGLDLVPYSYLEEDQTLVDLIKQLHFELDGVMPGDAFCGSGATALLVTMAAYFKQANISAIYYIPPIYFSLHFAMRLFGIRARPVSGRHAFEQDFSMNLPDECTVLVLTDPVWYAGTPIPESVLGEIAAWQTKTGSTVLVDGSFQYMPWNRIISEGTARLDPSLTIRLISPSKSLCVAGFRFAYLIIPPIWRKRIAHIYTNIYASASAETIAFGSEAVGAMRSRTITNKLVERIRGRHTDLRRSGVIDSDISASCGYFVFEKMNKDLGKNYVRMDGTFFDQPRYPSYTRINLLSPSYHLLEAGS